MRTRTRAALAVAAATLAVIALTAPPGAADNTDDSQIRYAARFGSWLQGRLGAEATTCDSLTPTIVIDEPSDFSAPAEEEPSGAWLSVARGTELNDVILVTVEPNHSGDTEHSYYDYLVDGGGGNDTVCVYSYGVTQPGVVEPTEIWVRGGAGDDWLWALHHAGLSGGEGNDWLLTTMSNQDHVVLEGGPGNDVLAGGAGDDYLYGNGGHDHLLGGHGDDLEFGGADPDLLDGEVGDDRLYGEGDANVLLGGEGDDVMWTHFGDSADGGPGNNVIYPG